jgi:hypothetical protein
MFDAKAWFTGITQGVIANLLYASLVAAGGLTGLWVLARRVRAQFQTRPVALAYPLPVSMIFMGNPADPMGSRVEVYCSVALYAVKRAVESPTMLLITATESPYEEICRVELGRPPSAVRARTWGLGLTYRASVKFMERHALLQAIARTHGGPAPGDRAGICRTSCSPTSRKCAGTALDVERTVRIAQQ